VITIKILGVAFTNGLPVIVRVQQIITSNDQALYARKFLRARALCETIKAVLRSVVLARFLYASSALLRFISYPINGHVMLLWQPFTRRRKPISCTCDLRPVCSA